MENDAVSNVVEDVKEKVLTAKEKAYAEKKKLRAEKSKKNRGSRPTKKQLRDRPYPRISGNDYCPCGSNLKFKKCCQNKKVNEEIKVNT